MIIIKDFLGIIFNIEFNLLVNSDIGGSGQVMKEEKPLSLQSDDG